MYWVLEHKYPEDCDLGEWVYIEGDQQQLKNWRAAFDYFFGIDINKRQSRMQYRLAPRFSTKPIPIEHAPQNTLEVRSGPWVIRQ